MRRELQLCISHHSRNSFIATHSRGWAAAPISAKNCNKDRVLIGKRCAGMGLSQQEQTHRMRIRSFIAGNANTKSNKCSAMVAKHGMEGKWGAMKKWAYANATETSLHSHGQILWLCSQNLWLYHSEDKGAKDRMNGPASSYTGSTANINWMRADS